MKAYQKTDSKVKDSIAIINQEVLLETAATGLLELSIKLGFEALSQILEMDVEALAGKKGKHNPQRKAYRHGNESTKVVLGGEKRSIVKPRVRSVDGTELSLPSLTWFQNEDPLSQAVMAKLLCGVSTRKYAAASDHPSQKSSCTSKSEVSRRFIATLEPMVSEFLSRPLNDDYHVIMIDGMVISNMTILAAMGIKKDGTKHILGVREGGTENNTVVKELLNNLISRGLKQDVPRLYVLDGGKALHKAVKDTFGKYALIQRCQVHKKRNVLDHLPKSEQANIGFAISRAYLEHDYDKAHRELLLISNNLEVRYPQAAASLLEGLEETLTVHKLKIPGLLRKTLCSTNPIESANSSCKSFVRNIKNWRDGEMILRNITAGFMQAEKGFRRINGYQQMPVLISSLDRHLMPESKQNYIHSA